MSSPQPLGFMRRWNRRIRRLTVILLVAALCALGIAPLAEEGLNELIRARVQDELSEIYPELEVRLRAARRNQVEGLELRGLTFRDPRMDPRLGGLLSVEEISLDCSASLQSLWLGEPRIRNIRLRRPRVFLQQRQDGSWNLEPLQPRTAGGARLADLWRNLKQIVVVDGELLLDETGSSRSPPLSARDVQLTLRPASRRDASASIPDWQFTGTLTGDNFRRATVQGDWKCEAAEWTVRGEVSDIQVVPELADRLPGELAESLRPLAALRGRTDLTYTASRRQGELEYDVEGHFYDGWIRDAALPYSLTDLQANFRLRAADVQITQATARLGAATLRLDLSRAGLERESPLRLHASTRQFPLDHRLPRMMPESLRELWDKFLPSGTAHIDMTLTFDGRKYRPDVSIEFPDLSFTFYKFPYRVHNAKGTMHVRQGKLLANLELPVNGQTVRLNCEVQPTDDGPLGWAELETDGPITLDEALLAAMPETAQATLRGLQPSGLVELKGRFERNDPEQEGFQRDLKIQIHQGAIRYDKFPVPIDRIQGTLTVLDDAWGFERLTGRNDSAFIVARGNWDPDAQRGHHLELEFVCSDVPLHDGLRQALGEEAQRLWSQLRPRGTIDHLTIDLRFQRETSQLDLRLDGEKWAPEQNVEGRTFSVKPVWFPFHLENVTGRFLYENGRLHVRDLGAEHGMARLKRGEAICSTNVDGSGQWTVEIPVLDVDQLEVNPELLTALPSPVSHALGKLGLRGPLSVAGSMLFTGHVGSEMPPSAQWNLAVDMENGEVNCGVKLKNVRGGVAIEGLSGPEIQESRAELFVDSLTLQDVRLTQVRGPVRLENGYLLIGTTAQAEPNAAGLPRSLTARVHGGDVALDGWLGVAEDNRFDVVAHLANADLARAAAESSMAMARITGKAFANLRLAGQPGASHSWRGQGSVRLFEADIYQLPLMVSLLKLLKIQPPDATAFTQSDMEFRVEGDRLYFDRIALQGDAVSLIGNGEMDLQRNLKLDFGAVVGREDAQLPWLRPFALGAARSVLGIQVTGPLQQPLVTPRPFPELNETLQQLLLEGVVDPALPWSGWLGSRSTTPSRKK